MDNEKELVRRAKDGDDEAFEELVRQNMHQVYFASLCIVKNHHDADDAAQNAFISAYRGLKNFKGKSSFRTWVTRIAINKAKDQIRRKGHREILTDMSSHTDPNGNSLSHFIRSDEKRLLTDAISNLPEKQRLVVLLRLKQSLNFSEISEILNISVNSAKVNFCHGIKKIEREIGGKDS
jgi:RNA polymerase sigma-70 factor (ECF subfamily)